MQHPLAGEGACCLSLLFPHLDGLQVERVEDAGNAVLITARSRAAQAACHRCGLSSAQVNSRYRRRLQDRPFFRPVGHSGQYHWDHQPLGQQGDPRMIDPNWIAAGAGVASAAANGVTMLRKSGDKAAPQPPAPAVLIRGVTSEALIMSALIIALALLAGALIIHHGLVA